MAFDPFSSTSSSTNAPAAATDSALLAYTSGKGNIVTLPGAITLAGGSRLNTAPSYTSSGSSQIIVNQGVDAATLNAILKANAPVPPPANSAGGVTDPSAPPAPGEATPDPEPEKKSLLDRITDGFTRIFTGDTEADGDLRKRAGGVALVLALLVAFLIWRRK